MRNVSDVSWKTRITGIDVSRQCMLDYSSNRDADKNESAIVSRKITFPRASIISEWQIYRAATRAYAEIREAMDVPSGNFLVRICLIVALTNGTPSEKWQKKYRLAADSGGKAITQRSLEKSR